MNYDWNEGERTRVCRDWDEMLLALTQYRGQRSTHRELELSLNRPSGTRPSKGSLRPFSGSECYPAAHCL